MSADSYIRDVSVDYVRRNRLGAAEQVTRALDGVSLVIPNGSIVGIAGGSGSGKSTLARCVAGWQRPTLGQISVQTAVQLVIQDPGASLNPRFSAFEVVEEPLRIRGLEEHSAHRVRSLLGSVGVLSEKRRAGEFSGGERARLAIARALAAMPEGGNSLLILDESTSSLDSATHGRIMDLLLELRRERELTLVLISHDVEMLAGFVNSLVTMRNGRIVEYT